GVEYAGDAGARNSPAAGVGVGGQKASLASVDRAVSARSSVDGAAASLSPDGTGSGHAPAGPSGASPVSGSGRGSTPNSGRKPGVHGSAGGGSGGGPAPGPAGGGGRGPRGGPPRLARA